MTAPAIGKDSEPLEYPAGSGIKIHRIRNKTGSDDSRKDFGHSFRVRIPARLNGGIRKDRQFADIGSAKTFARDELANLLALGEDFSKLNEEDRRIAVRAMRYAKQQEMDLMEAVEYSTSRMNPSGGDRTVGQVVDEFIEIKESRAKQGDLRERSLRDVRSRGSRLSKIFGERLIKTLAPKEIKQSLMTLGSAPRTRKNYRMVWGEIFKFAMQRRYIGENPIKSLSSEDEREIAGGNQSWTPPGILSIPEVIRLLKGAFELPELDLCAAVVLGLFVGVRTEEIKRLKWSDIHLDDPEEQRVTISSEVAKKRRLRHIMLETNAVEWLFRCNRSTEFVTQSKFENDYQRRFRQLLEYSGFGETVDGKWQSKWKKNGMRHSYGTYHFSKYRNSLQTASNLGHKSGDDVLFDHYRNLATRSEGEAYFNLAPQKVLDATDDLILLEASI